MGLCLVSNVNFANWTKIERKRIEDEYNLTPCACQNFGQLEYAGFSMLTVKIRKFESEMKKSFNEKWSSWWKFSFLVENFLSLEPKKKFWQGLRDPYLPTNDKQWLLV